MFGTKAVGVRIRGIDVMVNKCVVSDAGVLKTFGVDSAGNDQTPLVNLKDGSCQRALLHNKRSYPTLDAVVPCLSDLSLFIGLDRTDKQLNLPAQNIWHLHDWDHESSWKNAMNSTSILDSTADKTPFLFISNESAKDPDFPLKHPGKSTSEVIAMVKYDLFKQWEHTSHKLRHADYLEMKDKITESYLEAFYLHFPQARGHVVFTSLGTPLTM
jgi:all-trans-retinol 13,14-reductase